MRKFCGDNGVFMIFGAVLALLLCLSPARAQSGDDQYLLVLKLIQQGDTLNASGNSRGALVKYKQAEAALNAFQRYNPDWHTKIVAYRNNYLADKINLLSTNPAAAEKPPVNLEKPGESNAS